MGQIDPLLSLIQGRRVYIDTNIFVYFLERNERYFNLIVAETLYKPYQLNDPMRVSEFKAFFSNEEFLTVLPHSTKVFELAAELSPKRGMKLIDALHFATATLAGCHFMLTNDAAFKSSQEIQVIHLQESF